MATSVTGAQSFLDVFRALIVTADDESTPLLDILNSKGRIMPSKGGNAVNWPLRYTENAATANLSAEGASYGTSGNALYANATLAHSVVPLETPFEITGTAEDFNKGEGKKFDLYEQEFQSALKMHNGKREDNVITALEAAIDGDGSIYGLLRATYGLTSVEAESAAAALALSDMNTQYNALAADPRVADLAGYLYLSANARRNEYNEVAVGTGAGDARIATAQDQIIDAGKQRAKSQFNSIPWFEVSRMTAGTILLLDPMDVIVEQVRPVMIKEVTTDADKTKYVILSNETTTYTDPRLAAKITAYTP
jgi:hypothetical protein